MALRKFDLTRSYLRSRNSKFFDVKQVRMSLPVNDFRIVEYTVGYERPSSKVSPRLVLRSSPMPPDCCKDEKTPMRPPIGFCCCCWGWVEDCCDCCCGLKSMLAIEAKLPMSI